MQLVHSRKSRNIQNAVIMFRMYFECHMSGWVQFDWCPNNAPEVCLEGTLNAVRMQSECSRNGYRIGFERPRIQTKCSWNTSNVLLMYLECNVNVRGVSRILPEYFPIGYKRLPNLAFSLVKKWVVWVVGHCSIVYMHKL